MSLDESTGGSPVPESRAAEPWYLQILRQRHLVVATAQVRALRTLLDQASQRAIKKGKRGRVEQLLGFSGYLGGHRVFKLLTEFGLNIESGNDPSESPHQDEPQTNIRFPSSRSPSKGPATA